MNRPEYCSFASAKHAEPIVARWRPGYEFIETYRGEHASIRILSCHYDSTNKYGNVRYKVRSEVIDHTRV